MTPAPSAALLLGRRFQQPDQRSCGAAVLVMAEALRRPGYTRRLLAGGEGEFRREVLAMHQRTTGAVDVSGRLQPPWFRALGTPPWAIARQLGSRRVLTARVRRGRAWAALVRGLRGGATVPVFVGNRWSPRHVVLAVDVDDDVVRCYEPSSGRVVRITREDWVAGSVRLGGWRQPWFVVPPRLIQRS